MEKEMIKVGVANEKEKMISIEELKTWEPDKISYFSGVAFFKQDGVYYSMNQDDFKRIFDK